MPPRAPENVEVVSVTGRKVCLEFAEPYDNGGVITEFDLRYIEAKREEELVGDSPSSSKGGTWERLKNHQPLQATVENLEPGETYIFELSARNEKGASPWSRPRTRVTTLLSPPSRPLPPLSFSLDAEPRRDFALDIFWQRPYHNGRRVTQYTLKMRCAGKGGYGNDVILRDTECRGEPPERDNFGNPIVSRKREPGEDAIYTGTSSKRQGREEDSGWRHFRATGLLAATAYDFIVAATNDVGVSEFSSPSEEWPTAMPVLPQVLDPPVLSDETPSSITVTWQPLWDGGAPIEEYTLKR